MTPQELKHELERTAGHDFEAWLRKNLFDVLSALEKAQRVEELEKAWADLNEFCDRHDYGYDVCRTVTPPSVYGVSICRMGTVVAREVIGSGVGNTFATAAYKAITEARK